MKKVIESDWKPASPAIKAALEDVYHCAYLLSRGGSGQPRVSRTERRNDLIDARIKLLRLHQMRMTRQQDRLRSIDTVDYLRRQKTEPASMADDRLPVWSR